MNYKQKALDHVRKGRTDKPKCPYCESDLALFASTGQITNNPNMQVRNIEEPKYFLQNITLYCTSAKCTGKSLTGENTGYDIRVNHI